MKNPFDGLKPWQVWAAIGGGTAVGGYALYKHHESTGSWSPLKSSSSSATSGTTSDGTATSIDPVTGLAYSDDSATDPLTGQTYLAEAQQYGSVSAAEASVSAFGQSSATGSGIPVNPASPASSGSINTPVGSSVYTSNAAWSTAVQAGLEDVSGSTSYDGTDIGTALGDYLTQQPLTAAQAQVVNVAIGEFGPAPVGNLQVILKPTSVSSPTTSGTAPSVPVVIPNVTSDRLADAAGALRNAGFKVDAPAEESGKIGTVTAQSPKAGTKAAKGSTVKLTVKFS
jgi:hypothetical protein